MPTTALLRTRRACARTAGALLCLAAAGCHTLSPDTAVPIPTGFSEASRLPADPVHATWVRGFGSPELTRLVAGALADNLDIEAALRRIDQAEGQAVIARAALFPTLGLSSDNSRQLSSGSGSRSVSANSTSLGTSTGRGFTSNSFQLGLNASYELDLFGKNRFAAGSADETARASRFDRDTVALSTVASVANTYFSVLASQDRLRIAEDNLRIASRVLDAVRGRLGVGTGTALDVAQQESVVATQRSQIPPLRLQLAQDRNMLAVLVGRTPESIRVAGGGLDRLRLPGVRPGLPSQLLLRRPDIAREEANLVAAELSVASARAAFFPTIQLTAGGGFQSAALGGLFGANSTFYSLAAGLTQPIFDAGALQGQLAVQSGRAGETAATYRKAIIQSFTDVENALIAIRQDAEHEARLREAVAASRRALDITEQRLREGTIDVVTLFNIQTTLFNNQDALAVVRLLRFQASVSLFQALGGGWTQGRAVAVARLDPPAGPLPVAAP